MSRSPPPRTEGPEVREVREERREAGFPLFVNGRWEERFPGLAAGVTGAGEGPDGHPADFGLATTRAWDLLLRYEALAGRLGFPGVALPRQVHGDAVACVGPVPEGGLRFAGPADGLVTRGSGLLLAVTAADCVPVYLLHPGSGGLGLLHAGWRGVAAGILESGLRAMRARFGARPGELHLHLGPAICGDCYEVGPEVPRALGVDGEEEGDGPPPRVDLRRELARRAAARGVDAGRLTVSGWCTRCRPDLFHSHRGSGDAAGRMAAFLGWRHRPETDTARA